MNGDHHPSQRLLLLLFSATLIGVVFFSDLAHAQEGGPKPVCPLSDSQTQKSIEAFSKIADFLTHEPRCANCHGGVNPYIEGTGVDPEDPNPGGPSSQFEHGGGKQPHEHNVGPDGTGQMDFGCKKCHNNMAPRRDGSPSTNWTLAPSFLSFVDRDATALCKQMKRTQSNAEEFQGHLKDDNGGNNFAGTAYMGNRGLSDEDLEGFDVKIQPPSISHAALMDLGQRWIDAMGGEFKGDQGCGCEPEHFAVRLITNVEYSRGPIYVKSGMQVEVPLTFADDGSFTGKGTASIQGGGTMSICQGQGGGSVDVEASGHAVETLSEHSMHLQLDEASAVTVGGTATCPGGSASGSGSQWGQAIPPFDMAGNVGEAIDKPITDIPGFTSNMHLEIVKVNEASN
jgi:hypothetical protein